MDGSELKKLKDQIVQDVNKERREDAIEKFRNEVRRVIYTISENNKQIEILEQCNRTLRSTLSYTQFVDTVDITA